MGKIERSYSAAVWLVEVVVLVLFAGSFKVSGFGALDFLLLALAILSGWLRVRLEPSGYITLTPLVLFTTLQLAGPFEALVAAISSAIVGSKVFARRSWLNALVDTGEEGMAALSATVLAGWHSSFLRGQIVGSDPARFAAALIAYAVLRLATTAIRSNLVEGIRFQSFVRDAGKYMIAHLLFLGLLSVGLVYLYDRVGYLVLPLATIGLVEFYYPAKLISEQREVSFASLAMIAQAIDAKDPYTALHSRNVAEIAARIARVLRLPEAEVRKIRIGALLHDIGKIGVSGRIIRKPAELDASELLTMREHPVISANIMRPVELLSDASEIVRHHHEHFDGSGYPDGFVGEEIPIGSRVILVADAFDAMTTDRPYRRGRSKAEALRVLDEHSGKQFDERVVTALESILKYV